MPQPCHIPEALPPHISISSSITTNFQSCGMTGNSINEVTKRMALDSSQIPSRQSCLMCFLSVWSRIGHDVPKAAQRTSLTVVLSWQRCTGMSTGCTCRWLAHQSAFSLSERCAGSLGAFAQEMCSSHILQDFQLFPYHAAGSRPPNRLFSRASGILSSRCCLTACAALDSCYSANRQAL